MVYSSSLEHYVAKWAQPDDYSKYCGHKLYENYILYHELDNVAVAQIAHTFIVWSGEH